MDKKNLKRVQKAVRERERERERERGGFLCKQFDHPSYSCIYHSTPLLDP